MTLSLMMAFHSVTGRRMVEVYDNNGMFVAAICPVEDFNGIKIVSKYLGEVDTDDGSRSLPPVPSLNLSFKRVT